MPTFMPGRELSAAFYREVIEPAVVGTAHAAGLLGWGSDVLGYDTERSTDHGWGPRMQLFVEARDVDDVTERVARVLPDTFRGWATHFGWDNVRVRLLTPQQRLLEVTGGAVFRDDSGELTRVRALLDWYPDQVWIWLLACQWQRISQEEAFVGRTAEVGDELGSRIVAARVARDLMRLGLLIERRYAPYGKWLGTAFASLDVADGVTTALDRALAAPTYREREQGLADACQAIARRHNAIGLTAPVDPSTRPYHSRPFQVLHAERFVAAGRERLRDPDLRRLPLVGSVDQFVDSSDVLAGGHRLRELRALYEGIT